jgi:YggT family protein
MFVIANFLTAVASILDIVLTIYMYIIFASVFISFVSADPYNPIVRFIHAATDPIFYRIRRFLPLTFGNIDFSPAIVIFAIIFCKTFIIQSIMELAVRL